MKDQKGQPLTWAIKCTSGNILTVQEIVPGVLWEIRTVIASKDGLGLQHAVMFLQDSTIREFSDLLNDIFDKKVQEVN